MRRVVAVLVAALLGLAGSLGATLFLYRSAGAALDHVLEGQLRGAGRTAAEIMGRLPPGSADLRAVMEANGLEGAYVLSPSMRVVADATGPSGVRVDLLRVDAVRAQRAFAGEASVAFAYALGDLRVADGYFPVRSRDGAVGAVLVLEGGQAFAAARVGLRRALWVGVGLSLLGALALGAVARQWSRAEEERRRSAARAASGDALTRMAAMVAHEIRNPIGVIRGAVELVRERAGAALKPDDREALADVLGEVERLRRLTEDFLDLAREPALLPAPVDLAEIAAEAARGLERTYPSVAVRLRVPSLPLRADPGRLRQVLGNLLLNAAQAGARNVEVLGEAAGGEARVRVADDGPGVDAGLRGRLFDLFATGRGDGTGLGLAISRRIVERHGGTLALLPGSGPGAAFEMRLPLGAG